MFVFLDQKEYFGSSVKVTRNITVCLKARWNINVCLFMPEGISLHLLLRSQWISLFVYSGQKDHHCLTVQARRKICVCLLRSERILHCLSIRPEGISPCLSVEVRRKITVRMFMEEECQYVLYLLFVGSIGTTPQHRNQQHFSQQQHPQQFHPQQHHQL